MRTRCLLILLLGWLPGPLLAQSAWPTHHRDGRNSDYTPFPAAPRLEVAWTALDGHAILTAPTLGPDGSTLYVTTGQAETGNLHAFTRYGRRLWTHPGIDAKAITSSPLIGDDGTIYLTDRDQFWSVRPDGSTRWVQPVSEAFGTAFLLGSNGVGGITLDGEVLLFDRRTGALLATPLQLPGSVPPPPDNLPDLLQGLIDPAIARTVVAGLLGYGSLVNNTPALHPNGTLVLIATGDGFLHGIHMEPGRIEPVYRVAIGPNTGSSPALSADGSNLYLSDGDGFLQCHDPLTGALKYRLFTGKTFASPSVDERGTVYVGGGNAITSLRDGTIAWRTSLESLAQQLVKPAVIEGTLVPARIQPASVLTVTPRHIFLQADVGHPIQLPGGGQITTPRWTGLLVLDRETGRLAAPPLPLRDTGGAVVTLAADGRAYAPHGAITTSLANERLNPQLPRALRFPAPTGGFTALRPVDPKSLLREQVRTAQHWRATNEPEWRVLRKAMPLTLADTVLKGQLSPAEALRIGVLLQRW